MSRSPEALASVPPSFHSGVAITALRSGAFLTGLATALGPGSRRYRVGAMLTLLRVPLLLVHGERFALALSLFLSNSKYSSGQFLRDRAIGG
jgi:hypothetical protein